MSIALLDPFQVPSRYFIGHCIKAEIWLENTPPLYVNIPYVNKYASIYIGTIQDAMGINKYAFLPAGVSLPYKIEQGAQGQKNPNHYEDSMAALQFLTGTKGYKEGRPHNPNLPPDYGYMEKARNWSVGPRMQPDHFYQMAMNASGPVENQKDIKAKTIGRSLLGIGGKVLDHVLAVNKGVNNFAQDLTQLQLNDMPVRAMRIQNERIPTAVNSISNAINTVQDEGGILKYRQDMPENRQAMSGAVGSIPPLIGDAVGLGVDGLQVGATVAGTTGALRAVYGLGRSAITNRAVPAIRSLVSKMPSPKELIKSNFLTPQGLGNNAVRAADVMSIKPIMDKTRANRISYDFPRGDNSASGNPAMQKAD